jgi:hypothetical protein
MDNHGPTLPLLFTNGSGAASDLDRRVRARHLT